MRSLYLSLLLLIGLLNSLSAQLIEIAPTHNPILQKQARVEQKIQEAKLFQYTREANNIYRGADCVSEVFPTITVLSGTTQQICIDTSCLESNMGTITVNCGPSIGTLNAVADTTCYDYMATQTGLDTVCFKICDENNSCHSLIYPIRITEALNLPFFDDFAPKGPFPRSDRWVDKDVFINTTLAFEPLSIGVATFDGINSAGRPHGGGFGTADQLTSAFINLDGFTSLNNVYLSFWVQRKGMGDKPEESDALLLEFKNDVGEWEIIETFGGFPAGTPSDTLEAFQFQSFQITDNQFFHNAFQFRFANSNSRQGAVDLWHLDYIRLEANTNDSDRFNDIAFTQLPKSILKNYTSMPRSHFKGFEEEEFSDSISASFLSHYGTTEAITTSISKMTELTAAVSFPGFPILNNLEPNFSPGERKSVQKVNPNFNTYLVGLQNSFPSSDSLVFETSHILSKTGQSTLTFENDTAINKTFLYNYFAYDDGTAESNIVAQNIGTEIAVKFKANIADTLRAIQIHFPHINVDVSTQLFNMKVYIDQLDEDAEYQAVFKKPFYTDSLLDTLQGFTTYVLFDQFDSLPQPLAIPPGDFYISWQQGTTTNIPVGFDKNNVNGARQSFSSIDNGISWQPFPETFQGSIMIRPVVGDSTPVNTPTATSTSELPQLSEWMEIYPNPASDHLVFKLKSGNYADYEIQLFNNIGQLTKQGPAQQQWDLTNLPNGLYFLKIYNRQSNQILGHKLLILK